MRVALTIAFTTLFTACLSPAELAKKDTAETQTPPSDYFEQGWTSQLREAFYYTPQGSHMIRADWLAVLERPDGQGRFAQAAYLARFGFLPPDGPSELNPEGYPIGFTIERDTNQAGLTCSACHTANVRVGDDTLRIDGAPSHLDFDSFYQDLALAVSLTANDQERFARFAAALGVAKETAVAELYQRLTAYNVKLTGDALLRKPVLASGYGRVDALTQIINSIAVRDQMRPANAYPVAAPTSYPPLWLAPQLEFVQWSPIAVSPIARNGGQVLGVFGKTNLSPVASEEDAFKSSIRLRELHQMELWLRELQPPRWDETRMGAIDPARAALGETLFATHCAGCHNMGPDYARTDAADNFFQQTFIKISAVPIKKMGTDPTYSKSLLNRFVESTHLAALGIPNTENSPGVARAARFFTAAVGASIKRAIQDAGLTQQEIFEYNGLRFDKGEDGKPVLTQAPADTIARMRLKAGPLAAVWATGPYLHNGSVPTVYELLSPPSERRSTFWTGGQTIDLERLGYDSSEKTGKFLFNTRLAGNFNTGHAFPPAGLNHDERMAVIEYLKTQ